MDYGTQVVAGVTPAKADRFFSTTASAFPFSTPLPTP